MRHRRQDYKRHDPRTPRLYDAPMPPRATAPDSATSAAGSRQEFAATVVIVTKDRREEVLRAVRSAVAQTPPVEVLVVDDGSSDGTAAAIRAEFPAVRLERFERSEEVVARRNLAGRLASCSVLVGIDDDAELPSPHTVAQTLADLAEERVGAVAIPYVDLPRSERRVWQAAPSGDDVYVTDQFRATSYAIRRDLFLQLAGYRPLLVHGAEEPDLCLRLLDTGHVVRLGRADPIRHYGSPRRDAEGIWFRVCRSEILFAWHNVPMPYLPLRLLKVTVHQLWLGLGVRRPQLFLRAVLAGYGACVRERANRRPVSRSVYRLYIGLGKRPKRLEEIEASLPSPQAVPAAVAV